MTAYLSSNPHDTLVAGILIGLFLGFVGACLIFVSLRDEKTARRAEAIVAESPDERRQRLFDAECDKSLAIAAVELDAHRRLSSVAPVIPMPRKAGEWS